MLGTNKGNGDKIMMLVTDVGDEQGNGVKTMMLVTDVGEIQVSFDYCIEKIKWKVLPKIGNIIFISVL